MPFGFFSLKGGEMVLLCSLFALLAITVHLVSLHFNKLLVQSISKAFLIPSMSLLLFVAMKASGRSLHYEELILLPTLFCTLGDILLELKKKSIFFYIGAVSFVIGHICYSVFFLSSFGLVHSSLVIWAIIWSVGFLLTYRKVAKYGDDETPLQFLYIFFVLFMGVSLGCSSYNGLLYAKLIGMAGAFSFAYSDLMIIMSRIKKSDKWEMTIMVTYILANALIFLSLFLASTQ